LSGKLLSFFLIISCATLLGGSEPVTYFFGIDPILGQLFGSIFSGFIWVLIDSSRANRLLTWLKNGDTSDVAMRSGVWGEISDRVRKLVRIKEFEIKDSKDRLEIFLAAFQSSPNGVVLLDQDGVITWFNETASSHFGLQSGRDLYQHFGNLVRDPGFANYFSIKNFSNEIFMSGSKNTNTHPVKLSLKLHSYGKGRLLLISRDVTSVEQAEMMRRDFIANVSHEIRTPLTVLAGFVETLQSLPLDERERQTYLILMAKQADRMQSLVSDLLTLSRLEDSPPPGLTEWHVLSLILKQLEDDALSLSSVFFSGFDKPQIIKFEFNLELSVAGSFTELFSAISNLVNNAVRYTPAGGKINVVVKHMSDGRLSISVIDTGPGIAPEHISRITERFYRVDSSRSRDTGGTGLGLAIVKHVAQRHGADLKISSTLGTGSNFQFLMPANRVKVLKIPVSVVS